MTAAGDPETGRRRIAERGQVEAAIAATVARGDADLLAKIAFAEDRLSADWLARSVESRLAWSIVEDARRIVGGEPC